MPQTPPFTTKQYAANSVCYGCMSQPILMGYRYKVTYQVITLSPRLRRPATIMLFQNVLNGRIIATILDCHCNWAACWFLIRHNKLNTPPCTVTAKMEITLKKPTIPLDTLTLIALRALKSVITKPRSARTSK